MTEENENTEPITETQSLEELSPEEQVVELNKKVAELAVALAEAQEGAQKARNEIQYKEAELQTERRRFAEQRFDAARYRDEDILRDLLPAIEGLELSLGAEISDQWGEGVRLAVREVKRRLEMRGLTLIAPTGEAFDPNEHEAVGMEESTELQPGSVIRTIRAGFRLHDRVLQASQVIVST
jgi:molecular chaperone GrpE